MSAGKCSSDLMVLVNELRKTLQNHADPAKAGPMQAYMKSPMPFLGIQTPKLRTACRTVFARISLESPAAWQAVLEMLWRSAQYREERYAAMIVCFNLTPPTTLSPLASLWYQTLR